MSEYIQQAEEFLKRTGTVIKIRKKGVVEGFPFDNDKLPHIKYSVTLKRGMKRYTFPFYDSYYNYKVKKEPTAYDILASLQCYPIEGTIDDFAREFGYKINSVSDFNRVQKTWHACKLQYDKLANLFGINIEKLREIQ